MENISYSRQDPRLLALKEEKAQLQRDLQKKKPILFIILAGVCFLLCISFIRISIETLASPGDETLTKRVGMIMMLISVLALTAAFVFLVLFLTKIQSRKKKERRLKEIEQELQRLPALYGPY